MFQTDTPIQSWTEDDLKLGPFIKRFARPLLDAPNGSSLVVGLYAPWGQGKSSVLNLLARNLESLDPLPDTRNPRAVVVRFNPWLYNSVNALLLSFFETLNERVGGTSSLMPETRKTFSRALKGMAAFISPALALAGELIPVPGAATATRSLGELVKGALEGTGGYLEGGEASFARRKQEASQVLRQLASQVTPLRVVVLIDDLDRAEPPEVFAMLKLIRLVADLPNVSYVLAMDDVRVRSVLSANKNASYGADFLEKIVQIPVRLPPIAPDLLRSLVVSGAAEILRDAGVEASPVSEIAEGIYRASLYDRTIGRRVRTFRDRARLLNTLLFVVNAADKEQPEFHAIDVLLIAFLQTFFPDVYAELWRNRSFLLHDTEDRLTALWLNHGAKEKAKQERRMRFARIAGEDPDASGDHWERTRKDNDLEICLGVMRELFPGAEEGIALEGIDLQRARVESRIRTEEHFDGYFRLVPLAEEAPTGLVLNAVGALATAEDNATLIDEFHRIKRTLRPEQAENFARKLRDRLGFLTEEASLHAAERLPALAEVLPAQTIIALGVELLRPLLAPREGRGREITSHNKEALALLSALVRQVPDDTVALDLAEQYSKRGSGVIVLIDDDRKTLAEVGLERARKFFIQHPDVFSDLAGLPASHAIWTWRRLCWSAEVPETEGRVPEIDQYLQSLVEGGGDPTPIISLVAGWSDGPSLSHQSQTDIVEGLARLTDVSAIRQAAESFKAAGSEPKYQDLLEPFLGAVSQLTLLATTAHDSNPSAADDADGGESGPSPGEGRLDRES